MPGIYTHYKIFSETVAALSKRKKNYLLRSIEALFSDEKNIRSALFGSIGPDIFDFIPVRNKKLNYGHELSFHLHNGGTGEFIEKIASRVFLPETINTEWSTRRRAYLYGFISHVVADSVFNPFIYHFSGFPDGYSKNEANYYREQNLLFSYNIDNYFQFYHNTPDRNFYIEKMFPAKKGFFLWKIDDPVKTLILESVKESYPDLFPGLILKKAKNHAENDIHGKGYIDLLPTLIKTTYKLKKTENRRIINFLSEAKRKNWFFSDFTVRYPEPRRLNRHALNIHREKWVYPAGMAGYRYDSVEHLFKTACEKTAEVWEQLEPVMFGSKFKLPEELKLNSFTGEKGKGYLDLKIKSPLKISY